MAFTINTNIASLQSQEYLRTTVDFQHKTINRVTSGLRIISSGDDAAGLAIANNFRSDRAVLTQGIRNANDGMATLQTVDGGMNNISNLLDRARTLAAQSASGTFNGDRSLLNDEFQTVIVEINRQAQAIGMVAGGDFSKLLSVFIGGGRDAAGGDSAITNGSVSFDLTSAKLDATSLGLASNGATGTGDVRASTTTLNTAIGLGAGTWIIKGSGFETGVTITADATAWTAMKNETDLVNVVNNAIDSAAASNSLFAGANIRASINSTGNLVFNSAKAFQVTAGAGGAATISGAAAVDSGGASAIYQKSFTPVTGTQSIIFGVRDANGVLQPNQVDLTAVTGANLATAVATINADLNGWNGVFAVADTGGTITFMRADGGEFQLNVQAGSAANGVNSGVLAEFGSARLPGATSVDISTIATATSAVTSLADAVANLGTSQATVGRAQNQLSYAISLASTQLTNLAASESRIRDADLANEAANLAKAQVLLQAGIAALAQANSAPQAVLALLQG